MPKNKFEDVIFTAVMAIVMVYGMIVYNVALNTGGTVSGFTFLAAVHELVFMAPIAFVLEFFVVSKLAGMLAFKIMKPTDRPQFITYAISICICCIMCPVMSLIATVLFKEPSFGTWIRTWAMNFPMAICYQMFLLWAICEADLPSDFPSWGRRNNEVRVKSSITFYGSGPNIKIYK